MEAHRPPYCSVPRSLRSYRAYSSTLTRCHRPCSCHIPSRPKLFSLAQYSCRLVTKEIPYRLLSFFHNPCLVVVDNAAYSFRWQLCIYYVRSRGFNAWVKCSNLMIDSLSLYVDFHQLRVVMHQISINVHKGGINNTKLQCDLPSSSNVFKLRDKPLIYHL
uniref:Uncharacterized protein n=1 Tax=Daphnia galeata TaxID=27404 RepID=A0A8J2S1I5_9CRUS|nr:unnamed protein product [Daphnia galeata]